MDKKTWKLKFSRALRTKMSEKEITVYELGGRSGIQGSSLYAYLEGKSMPNAYNINRIASVLDCSTDELINFNLYED